MEETDIMRRLFQRAQQEEHSPAFMDYDELLRQIDQTKEEINTARNHFEQALDPTLIDCYIYEINAAQLRYQFLLRHFKTMEKGRSA